MTKYLGQGCGKDIRPQLAKVMECDLGFFHYPCINCFNKIKKKEQEE